MSMQRHSACVLCIFSNVVTLTVYRTLLLHVNLKNVGLLNQQFLRMRGIINPLSGNAHVCFWNTADSKMASDVVFHHKKPFQIPEHFSICPSCKCASSRHNLNVLMKHSHGQGERERRRRELKTGE